jgi:hypothetical protein
MGGAAFVLPFYGWRSPLALRGSRRAAGGCAGQERPDTRTEACNRGSFCFQAHARRGSLSSLSSPLVLSKGFQTIYRDFDSTFFEIQKSVLEFCLQSPRSWLVVQAGNEPHELPARGRSEVAARFGPKRGRRKEKGGEIARLQGKAGGWWSSRPGAGRSRRRL